MADLCIAPPPPPFPPLLPGECSTGEWPHKETTCRFATTNHPSGLCKALVDFRGLDESSCTKYCESVGRECDGAYEDQSDTCNLKKMDTPLTCDSKDFSSDAICECGDVLSASALDSKMKKVAKKLAALKN